MSKFDDLVKKLKEIFQIDRPELDFGVYRILNARVGEINDYLDHRLKNKVADSLAVAGSSNTAHLINEIAEKEAQYRADGIDPDSVPKLRELRQKLGSYRTGVSEHENAVFSHLLTFFSRYYDNGDFISQRRYKGDTYAIPYAGEEVVLHWANKDQYYTKSSENFSHYGFKLDDGRTVRFRLIAADTAKDNRKDNDKERRFVLIEAHTRTQADDDGDEHAETLQPISEENGELVIRFAYQAMPKGTKQDVLNQAAVQTILADAAVKAHWLDLTKREPTEKNPQRTLLEKMLTNYTSKNSADYFIHKDLGGFLRRELDFYIKNEVMHLDDVQAAETFADIEKALRLIQTLRAIALDLIAFLAQLEDFQKKLWLKKKFVVATHYCMTLDRVPATLYPAIAANPAQWQQWETLGMLGGNKDDLFKQAAQGTLDYLHAHPYLMVDTALFDAAFKAQLLASVDNLDDNLDGLLIHGDNFQALNLLQERYREQVKCIYIDPPYNTGNDGFCYKDGYLKSSWVAMLWDRLKFLPDYMHNCGAVFVSIDENEFHTLRILGDTIFGKNNLLAEFTWLTEGNFDNQAKIKIGHEYILSYAANEPEFPSPPTIDPSIPETSKLFKDQIRNTIIKNGQKNPISSIVVPVGFPTDFEEGLVEIAGITYPQYSRDIIIKDFKVQNEVIATSGWSSKALYELFVQSGMTKVSDSKGQLTNFVLTKNGAIEVIKERSQSQSYVTSIIKSVGTIQSTSSMLNEMGIPYPFYPKPIKLISYLASMIADNSSLVLDYFAGSGTTAHAVINLNREDSGKRKYILVEQGDYFDTVLKPRIQKVVYSADWKDGKATAPHTGISHAFKVLKLESYEDTLNNLQLRRSAAQQSLLDSLSQAAQEDYLLRYVLDIESRGSLLSVAQFNQPFDYQLKVTVDSAGAYAEQPIDLVETFNYLIGLRVKHIDIQLEQGVVVIEGWLPTGEKTLVLWRDCARVEYEKLNRLCEKLAINPADSEFEVVYINGDHNIPAVFTHTAAEGGITKTLKIRQIEAEFLSRMFG